LQRPHHFGHSYLPLYLYKTSCIFTTGARISIIPGKSVVVSYHKGASGRKGIPLLLVFFRLYLSPPPPSHHSFRHRLITSQIFEMRLFNSAFLFVILASSASAIPSMYDAAREQPFCNDVNRDTDTRVIVSLYVMSRCPDAVCFPPVCYRNQLMSPRGSARTSSKTYASCCLYLYSR